MKNWNHEVLRITKKIDKGKSIGYLKGKTGGSWVARLITPGESQQFHKIQVQDTDPQKVYGEALKKAQEWFDLKSRGVQTDYLLENAIEDYILYLQTEKSNDVWKTAANVLKNIPPRLKNTPVYKLTTHQLDRWRTAVVKQSDDPETVRKSKNTSNRRWSDLRACLNRAFKQGYVADRTAWERIIRANCCLCLARAGTFKPRTESVCLALSRSAAERPEVGISLPSEAIS